MIHEKAIKALKRAISLPKRTFEHYKGKIQEVNKQRREREYYENSKRSNQRAKG